MKNIIIDTRDEHAKILKSIGMDINDFDEFDNAIRIAYSSNEENPYYVVEYEDGSVWMYGCEYDREIESFGEGLELILDGETELLR